METIFDVFARGLIATLAVVALTRLNGLRSFSKISSVDFALTVATGSVLATALTSERGFGAGLVALGVLFVIQGLVSRLRARLPGLRAVVDNSPLLLMEEGAFIEANMTSAQITRADVRAKLRQAGAVERRKIRAVVLETTGDVSVIYAAPEAELAEGLLDGVSREPRALP
ncbi:DUF421 domain-containing protein [Pseudoroseicyclus sp. CXY001]|uniref:DUF421 domain-containing protein n=1 Tax=Pseudoroseicyclus sp. CXY001 TaxID=3242492 RepID=UPI0035712227